MNIIIGLTGPTGSGKSSAGAVCKELGLKLVDCDKLARVAVEKGSDGLTDIVKAFGEDVLNPDGTLNRKALAGVAFSSGDKTELLNKTIFPHIKRLVLNETQEGKILLDAPTLFESGIDGICFKTVAVLSDRKTRLERIIARDGLTEKEAILRINAGKTDDFYLKNADYVIYNDQNEDTFIKSFKQTITEILKLGENL